MSDIKNKFRGLFGKNSSAEGDAENSAEKRPENIAEYPDEIHEEAPAVADDSAAEASDSVQNETVSDDVNETSEADVAVKEEDSAEIEQDAKSCFNSTYHDSLDDKIKSIRENALNTYAKENNNSNDASDAGTEENSDASDDDMKIMSFGDDEAKKDEGNSNTRNYDMTQLIELLKEPKCDSGSNNDTVKTEDKPKEHNLVSDTDNELKDDEPAVNEYPRNFEYIEECQNKDLFTGFRKSAIVSTVSLIATFILTVLCMWVEIGHGAGLPFEHMLQPGYYGKVFAMASLQLLALCVLVNLDGIRLGLTKLSVKKAAPEAVAVVAVLVCVIHTIYTAVFAYNCASYATYCFSGCVVMLLLSFNNFTKAYTRFKAFTMILAKKPKLTMTKLNDLSEECGVFAKYFIENSEAFTVSKADFISDFAKNTCTIPSSVRPCNVLVYLSFALGVVTAVVKAMLFEAGAYEAVTSGVSVFMFSAPVSFLIVAALPYFISSVRAFARHNAILGEAACDRIEDAAVLSFDDTEVFPPKTVKVTNIKTYNDNRIDKAIVCMAKVFAKLGGPLSHVFASSVQDNLNDDENVMVIESSKDGLHLTVDGEDVLIGNGNYLRMFDIEAPVDENDESEIRALTGILYLVISGSLSAKFYIRYAINRKFESLLKRYYDAGICCGVKTNDPCIDNRLIEANLSSGKYPISVILKNTKDIGKIEKESSGILIGLSGIHNYLHSFIMLDRLRDTYKTNAVLSILGTIAGLAVSMIYVFIGTAITSVIPAAFYLVWLVIMFLISFLRK